MRIGDRVRFKAEWLRSTGSFTGPVPFARGTVTRIEPLHRSERSVVWVQWDEAEGVPPKALNVNLEVCR